MTVKAERSPRAEVLVDLIQRHGWTRGAELGVEAGKTFLYLLRNVPTLSLVGVDKWRGSAKGRDRAHLFNLLRHEVAKRKGRAQLIREFTVDAARLVPPRSLDFVFIDADHSEDAVRADIRNWAPCVRPGGWITGHDYDLPGVAAALATEAPTARRYSKGSQVWGVPVDELRNVSRDRGGWARVLGGAECVWDDVSALSQLLGRPWPGITIAANDIGCVWPEPIDHWVTLHCNRMKGWEQVRKDNELPGGYTTWGGSPNTVKKQGMDCYVDGWRTGSSGLLAVGVALDGLGCTKVVLCGVPLTVSPHFKESVVHTPGEDWRSAEGHWNGWLRERKRFESRVRSMSGRTRHKLLGPPTMEWFNDEG